jgi:hypothetical protein
MHKGDCQKFQPADKLEELCVIGILENKEGLRVDTTHAGDNLMIFVTKEDDRRHSAADDDLHAGFFGKPDPEVDQTFQEYASGDHHGMLVFCRKADLQNLARSLHAMEMAQNRHEKVQDLLSHIDRIYEDMLELQIDFGVHTNHGLTLEYFNVFLQKVANSLGWSLATVLKDLLNQALAKKGHKKDIPVATTIAKEIVKGSGSVQHGGETTTIAPQEEPD